MPKQLKARQEEAINGIRLLALATNCI